MEIEASAPFETIVETGQTGLVGTITFKVDDNDGGTTIGPTTANVTEIGVTGIYVWNAPAAPASLGQYTILSSTSGDFTDPDSISHEELVVVAAGALAPSPIPSPDSSPATVGPCTAWITGDDVADCCAAAVADVGTYTVLLDDAADVASQLLYELSGRRFAGLCSRDGVRPCHGGCDCNVQILSRGHIVGDSSGCSGNSCWCHGLSRVKLAGYVREITQVKIDGDVLDPSEYRVDEHKYLTRMNGNRWPSCSRADLDDTEDGTFSVSYTYGKTPPLAALDAAKQFACQIYQQCSPSGGGGAEADCQIPANATRVSRQGITVDQGAIFTRNPVTGAWETGMVAVDFFLNTYNRKGIQRRGLFFGPGRRFARPVG